MTDYIQSQLANNTTNTLLTLVAALVHSDHLEEAVNLYLKYDGQFVKFADPSSKVRPPFREIKEGFNDLLKKITHETELEVDIKELFIEMERTKSSIRENLMEELSNLFDNCEYEDHSKRNERLREFNFRFYCQGEFGYFEKNIEFFEKGRAVEYHRWTYAIKYKFKHETIYPFITIFDEGKTYKKGDMVFSLYVNLKNDPTIEVESKKYTNNFLFGILTTVSEESTFEKVDCVSFALNENSNSKAILNIIRALYPHHKIENEEKFRNRLLPPR